MVTVSTTRPRRNTVVRCAISAISASLCVTSTSPQPRAASRRQISSSAPTSRGGNTAVGSSSTSSCGPSSRQRSTSMRWRSPTESSSTGRLRSTSSPYSSQRTAHPLRHGVVLQRPARARARAACSRAPSCCPPARSAGGPWPCPRPRRAPGRPAGNAAPPSRRCPASGRCTPNTMLHSVLLPAPFSPSRQCTSPACDVQRDVFQGWPPAEVLRDSVERQHRRRAAAGTPAVGAPAAGSADAGSRDAASTFSSRAS